METKMTENWHTWIMRIVRNRTDAELAGPKADLEETIEIQERLIEARVVTPKYGKYIDELHYVNMEIKRRKDAKARDALKGKGALARLRKGKAYVGTGFIGCVNTGRRALIVHSRLGVYLVGTENAVSEARRFCAFDNPHFKARKVGTACGDVWVYKTGSSAWKRFHEINQVAIDYNREELAEMKAMKYAAAKGDVGAALELGLDH